MTKKQTSTNYMSRSRAYWRIARKKQKEGDYKSAELYDYKAKLAHNEYRRSINSIIIERNKQGTKYNCFLNGKLIKRGLMATNLVIWFQSLMIYEEIG